MDPNIQKRIDELYADMKPLQEYYGIKSRTIDERYQEHLRKKAEQERALQALQTMAKPRFKLPKL
jgi:hypothetical protein